MQNKELFVIVPIEPTQEMADAGFSRYKRTTVGAYEVMIAAAPSHNLAIIDKGELEALRAKLEHYRDALSYISQPSQDSNLLWWQETARTALKDNL